MKLALKVFPRAMSSLGRAMNAVLCLHARWKTALGPIRISAVRCSQGRVLPTAVFRNGLQAMWPHLQSARVVPPAPGIQGFIRRIGE
jgi:hypothetical protein